MKVFRSLLLTGCLTAACLSFSPAFAAGGAEKPPSQSWSFAGPFGTFDRAQLQRGFKIYKEVCSSCHGMEKLSFRNLVQPGGPEFTIGQIQTLASEYQAKDGPNDQGEMFERPARLSDRWPSPFPNPEAAKAANGGAYPPDFSVIAKARTYERGLQMFPVDLITQYQEHGVNYITALLTGYTEPPAGMVIEPGLNYNRYFPGNKIAMANPLVRFFDESGKALEPEFYTDGTAMTPVQVGKDVAAFLAWAAEPHMEARKQLGAKVMIWLLFLAGLLYFLKKRIWARLDQEPASSH